MSAADDDNDDGDGDSDGRLIDQRGRNPGLLYLQCFCIILFATHSFIHIDKQVHGLGIRCEISTISSSEVQGAQIYTCQQDSKAKPDPNQMAEINLPASWNRCQNFIAKGHN